MKSQQVSLIMIAILGFSSTANAATIELVCDPGPEEVNFSIDKANKVADHTFTVQDEKGKIYDFHHQYKLTYTPVNMVLTRKSPSKYFPNTTTYKIDRKSLNYSRTIVDQLGKPSKMFNDIKGTCSIVDTKDFLL